jgi:hypothetical protein
MSDKPREWPNVQKEARDQSAERAVKGILLMQNMLDNWFELSETEKMRRVGIGLNCLQFIARSMEMCGAPTRPIE